MIDLRIKWRRKQAVKLLEGLSPVLSEWTCEARPSNGRSYDLSLVWRVKLLLDRFITPSYRKGKDVRSASPQLLGTDV